MGKLNRIAFLVMVFGIAGPALGNDVSTITIGETLEATLPPGEPGNSALLVDVTAESDVLLVVEATSLEFDPVVFVHRVESNGALELVGGTAPDPQTRLTRFVFPARADSRYRVEVRPKVASWEGEIAISVSVESSPASDSSRVTDEWQQVAARAKRAGDPLLEARALAAHAASSGRLRERRSLLEESAGIYERELGADHPAVAVALLRLVGARLDGGDHDQARAALDRSRVIIESTLGNRHPAFADLLVAEGRYLESLGLYVEAGPPIERATALAEAIFGRNSLSTANVLEIQGRLLSTAGDPAEATIVLERALENRTAQLGPIDSSSLGLLKRLAVNFEQVQLYDPAKAYYERALAVARASKDAAHRLDAIWALDGIVGIPVETDDEEARGNIREILKSELKDLMRDRNLPADLRKPLAELALEVGFPKMAETVFEENVLEHQRDPVTTLDLSRFYSAVGMYELAIPGFTRVLATLEDELSSDHARVAAVLEELGVARWRSGSPSEARSLLHRVVEIREGRFGPRSAHLGFSLVNLATLDAGMAAFDSAGRLGQRGLEILGAQLDPANHRFKFEVAKVAWSLRAMGAYDEVEKLLASVSGESTRRFTLDDVLLSRDLLLAEVRLRQGSLDEARAHLVELVERADSFMDGKLSPKTPFPGGRATGFGWKARNYFPEIREILVGDVRKKNRLLKLYGPGGGMRLLNSPMMVAREPLKLVDPRTTLFFEVTGEVLRASDQFDHAVAVERWGSLSMMLSFGKEHPAFAAVLDELAWSFWDTEEEKHESSGGGSAFLPFFAWKITKFAGKAASGGALGAAEMSASLMDKHLHDSLAFLPEAQALQLVSAGEHPEGVLFSGLLFGKHTKDPRTQGVGEGGVKKSAWLEACWEWTLRRKALVLDELAYRRQQVLRSESAEARVAWESWVDARSRLAALWVQGTDPNDTPHYLEELDEARRARDRAEAELAKLSVRYREARENREIRLKAVANALPPKSALVEYVRVAVRKPGEHEDTSHYVALILQNKGKNRKYADLGPAEVIDDLVREWHEMLRHSYETGRGTGVLDVTRIEDTGRRLRRAVWDPVASRLAKSTELVLVVPDGSLHRVNVSALPSEKNGYLLENGPSVQILSTGRDVTRIQRTSWSGTEANGLLAVGNPDYNASPEARIARLDDAQPTTVYRGGRTDCAALREIRWADLPQSGHEVEQIAALFSDRGPVVVLVGTDASEERFKREAPGKKVLHLATHGFFLQGDCASAENVGRGIASPTGGGGAKAVASSMENPLLLSGLVFAGANRIGESSDEDGILTAEELAVLDLRGTELVALSACDTGLGTVEVGEGVLGLRRALEIAGARTILMSLWPVPDEQARQWMTSFYAAKLGGRSVVEASREASLGILAELRERDVRPHPYLWAGFVAAGDWR